MILTAQRRRLLALFEARADEELTVEDVAWLMDRSMTSMYAQLQLLAEHGALARRPERAGVPGRPRLLFRAVR